MKAPSGSVDSNLHKSRSPGVARVGLLLGVENLPLFYRSARKAVPCVEASSGREE